MNRSTPARHWHLTEHARLIVILLVCLVGGVANQAMAKADESTFPRYPIIENNVRFWKDIYTKYSLNTAVIHDKNNLSIVYEVVELLDEKLPGAQKLNKKLLDAKKNHYAAILRNLSGGNASTSEERRIATLFPKQTRQSDIAEAAESIRVQTGQKDRFLEGVIRSGAYMAAIKKVFRSYGLPQDLAYLPHVESSFDTKAYSKLGASGIWQFTYSTGKQSLRIDSAIDERGDPILAAHAAAKYLKNSYNLLGTWPLALTSYNYGTGGMKRALRDKGSYERIFREYNQGHFKFASRNFYSEFLAALEAAKEYERNEAIRLDQPLAVRTISLKGKATAKEISRHFGVSLETLQRFNPALRPAVFSGQRHIPKGYALKLPATGKTPPVEKAVASSRIVSQDARNQPIHTVRKGDTLTKLANKYRTTTKSIVAENNLQGQPIRVGQVLRIPQSGSAADRVATNSPDKKKTSSFEAQQSSDRYRVFQSIVRDGRRLGKIQVQPNETLELLAEWAATTPSTLQKINRMSAPKVHPGSYLVMLFDKVTPGEFQKKRLVFHQQAEMAFFSSYSVVGVKKYTVASDDTIWDICHNKFTIPIWLLQKYNAAQDLSQLRSSTELVIPIVKAI